MILKVLALDPGEKFGWAVGEIDTDKPSLQLINYGIATMKNLMLTLADRASRYDVIVYESYQIKASHARAHIGSSVPTLQAIGMVRLSAWLAQDAQLLVGKPGPQLIEQRPSDKPTGRSVARGSFPAMSVLIEEALDLDDAGQHDEAHHGDAIMHLVAYYHKHYGGKHP